MPTDFAATRTLSAFPVDPGLLASAAASTALVLVLLYTVSYVGRRGLDRILVWLTVVLVACLWWSSTQFLKLAMADEAAMLALHKAQLLGMFTLPVAWLCFALVYTDRGRYVTPYTVSLLLVPAALTVAFGVTNFSYHELVWTEYTVTEMASVTTIEATLTVWMKASIAYGYLLALAGIYLFFKMVLYSDRVYRGQAALITVGVLTPLILNVVYRAELFFVQDPTPVGFSVSVVCLALAIYRYRLLDIVPVARKSVVESMRDPYFVLDGEGRLVDANGAAREIVDESQPIGLEIQELLPEIEQVIQQGGGELSYDSRHFSVTTTPLGDQQTSERGTLLMLRDVTRRKQHERRLEKANERLDEFAGIVSHDLRNPLSVAQGYVDRAAEDPEAASRVEEALDRMDTMIEDILSMARRGEADVEPLDIGDVAEAAWDNVDTREATLEVESTREIHADEDKLLSALENLFRNAVEHGGDTVEVTVGATEDGFYVKDDGPGFHEALKPFAEDDDRPGLGLWIVGEMAEIHGWEVEASNEDGARVDFLV